MKIEAHNNSTQFMKLSLLNFHELAINRIKTQLKKLSLMNHEFHELAMKRIKTYLVHNKSSKWWTLTNNHGLNNETYQVHNN